MSFKSWQSYRHFEESVKKKSRYVLEEDAQSFLKGIKDTCTSRVKVIKPNTTLWRAQMGHHTTPVIQEDEKNGGFKVHVDDIYVAYSEQRMRPLADSATEGRANPKGIPCLYVASEKETAMSEIRPWMGSIISIAEFKNTEELKIIDFSLHHDADLPWHIDEPDNDNDKIKDVWTFIDKAFSKPVTNSDQKSDYAPTQIIADLIKSLGFDGIAFRSSLGGGLNYALFDLNSVDFITSNLYEVGNIQFSFRNCDDPRVGY